MPEVSQAMATAALAFSTDPVARWIYEDPHQYLRPYAISLYYSALLLKVLLNRGRRSAPAAVMALRSGFRPPRRVAAYARRLPNRTSVALSRASSIPKTAVPLPPAIGRFEAASESGSGCWLANLLPR